MRRKYFRICNYFTLITVCLFFTISHQQQQQPPQQNLEYQQQLNQQQQTRNFFSPEQQQQFLHLHFVTANLTPQQQLMLNPSQRQLVDFIQQYLYGQQQQQQLSNQQHTQPQLQRLPQAAQQQLQQTQPQIYSQYGAQQQPQYSVASYYSQLPADQTQQQQQQQAPFAAVLQSSNPQQLGLGDAAFSSEGAANSPLPQLPADNLPLPFPRDGQIDAPNEPNRPYIDADFLRDLPLSPLGTSRSLGPLHSPQNGPTRAFMDSGFQQSPLGPLGSSGPRDMQIGPNEPDYSPSPVRNTVPFDLSQQQPPYPPPRPPSRMFFNSAPASRSRSPLAVVLLFVLLIV